MTVRMRAVKVTAMAIFLAVTPMTVMGQTGAPAELVDRQERVRGQSREAAAALNTLLADFDQNGLGDSAEARTIRELAGALTRLSDEDISRVLAALRASAVLEAHAGQQSILSAFRQILADFRKRHDLASLIAMANNLAERQRRAFVGTLQLARPAGGGIAVGWGDTPELRGVLGAGATEQGAILGDMGELLAAARGISEKLSSEEAGRVERAVRTAEVMGLLGVMQAAAADLAGARMFRGAMSQQAAAEGVRKFAEMLAGEGSREEQLEALAKKLEEQMRAEGAVGEKPPEERARAQSEVLEAAKGTQAEAGELAPEAAGPMGAATAAMSAAREKLERREGASAEMAAATKSLQEAHDAVMREMSRPSAETREAARALDEAIDRQAAAAQAASDAAARPESVEEMAEAREAQGQAQAAAESARQAAVKASPQAAQRLAAAQKAIEAAREQLGQKQMAQAQVSQRDAAQELRAARRSLRTGKEQEESQRQAAEAADAAKRGGQKMQEGDSEGAAKSLAQAAKNAESASARSSQSGAGQKMAAAAEALRQASSAAKAGNGQAAASAAQAAEQMAAAQAAAQAEAKMAGAGDGSGARTGARANEAVDASGNGAREGSAFIALPPRDRAALEQSKGDPVPAEYAPLIEGYRRSLATEGAPR